MTRNRLITEGEDLCEGCGSLFNEADIDERGYCENCASGMAAVDDEECE